jgi:hypothetical protein
MSYNLLVLACFASATAQYTLVSGGGLSYSPPNGRPSPPQMEQADFGSAILKVSLLASSSSLSPGTSGLTWGGAGLLSLRGAGDSSPKPRGADSGGLPSLLGASDSSLGYADFADFGGCVDYSGLPISLLGASAVSFNHGTLASPAFTSLLGASDGSLNHGTLAGPAFTSLLGASDGSLNHGTLAGPAFTSLLGASDGSLKPRAQASPPHIIDADYGDIVSLLGASDSSLKPRDQASLPQLNCGAAASLSAAALSFAHLTQYMMDTGETSFSAAARSFTHLTQYMMDQGDAAGQVSTSPADNAGL